MRNSPSMTRSLLLCSGILLWPTALAAQSVQTGVDLSASAEATNNPYLMDEDSGWVGAGSVEARPWLRSETERDSITLAGLARLRAFSSRYDMESVFGGSVNAQSRLNERTSAYGSASLYSTNRRTPFGELTARPGLTDPIVPPTPDVPIAQPIVVLPDEDITLLGLTGRSTTASANAGISRQVDERSQAGINVGYSMLDVSENGPGIGYQSANLGLNYSRTFTERTQGGFSAGVSRTIYEEGRPSATSVNAFANVNHQISQYWSLSASAGVSASRSEGNALFPGYNVLSPVGSVSLCNRPVDTNFCLSYSRSQQPSTLGDVRTSDAFTMGFSRKLSDRQRIDLSGSYSRNKSQDNAAAQFPNVEVASLRSTFTQTLSDRTEGYLFASASRSRGSFLTRDPSLSFGLGVRLRLGERR